jgi:hypothetical protein
MDYKLRDVPARRSAPALQAPDTKKITFSPRGYRHMMRGKPLEVSAMAASQVILYFDKPEDALQFTLAASSVMSADNQARRDEALNKIAYEISKASRITTNTGVLKPDDAEPPQSPKKKEERCA